MGDNLSCQSLLIGLIIPTILTNPSLNKTILQLLIFSNIITATQSFELLRKIHGTQQFLDKVKQLQMWRR